MNDPRTLFAEYDLRKGLEASERNVKGAIGTYDADAFLAANVEDLVGHFVESVTLSAPRLLEDEITADIQETKIDVSHRFEYGALDGETTIVPGMVASLHVPFIGDASLFDCVASRGSMNPPRGYIEGEELILTFRGTIEDSSRVKDHLHKELGKAKQHLRWLEQDIQAFHDRLPRIVREEVESRRARLLGQRNLAASLGYPVRQRDGAPRSYAVPAKRKTVARRPPGSGSTFVPEPTLDDTIYEEILTVLANMVQVMEQSPDAFAGLGEQDLRTHFLVQLNGQFEVGVSGETFRGSGSTDILLAQEGRSVFLAECKFWRGPKSLQETLDQLLDYAIWRDGKAAILLFNRNKDFSAVLEKIPDVIEAYPRAATKVRAIGETGFRFSLRQRDDQNRLVLVTLLAFDVPTDRGRSKRLAPRTRETR